MSVHMSTNLLGTLVYTQGRRSSLSGAEGRRSSQSWTGWLTPTRALTRVATPSAGAVPQEAAGADGENAREWLRREERFLAEKKALAAAADAAQTELEMQVDI